MARISYERATGGETKRTVDYDAMEIAKSVVWIRENDGGMVIIPLGKVNFIEVDEDELPDEAVGATDSIPTANEAGETESQSGKTAD